MSKPRVLHKTDLGAALVILALCAALYYETTRFDEVADLFQQNIPPAFFPRLVIWTIVALALLLPFEHLLLARRGDDVDADRAERVRPVAFQTAALLAAVAAAIPVLGLTLAMAAACVFLPLLWGERRWKRILPFAILFPAAVTFVFGRLLGVHFHPGLLGLFGN